MTQTTTDTMSDSDTRYSFNDEHGDRWRLRVCANHRWPVRGTVTIKGVETQQKENDMKDETDRRIDPTKTQPRPDIGYREPATDHEKRLTELLVDAVSATPNCEPTMREGGWCMESISNSDMSIELKAWAWGRLVAVERELRASE